jgi:hypothetical protein
MTFDSNEKVVSILRALNTHGIYSKQFTVSPDRAAIQNSHSEVYFEIKKDELSESGTILNIFPSGQQFHRCIQRTNRLFCVKFYPHNEHDADFPTFIITLRPFNFGSSIDGEGKDDL